MRFTPILFLYKKGLVLYGMKASGQRLRGTLLILFFSVDLIFLCGGGGSAGFFLWAGGEVREEYTNMFV